MSWRLKLRILVSSLLLFIVGCQTPTVGHAPMFKERIAPRPGYEGMLTNRICKKELFGSCQEWSVKTYDIKDPKVRKAANDFGMACQIGGKRFRICMDKTGFCRREQICLKWSKSWFGMGKEKCRQWETKETYIDISQYLYLIEAGTECMRGF